MKSVKGYAEIVECYIDCPYCQKVISRDDVGHEFFEGDGVKQCIHCNKKFNFKR